MLFSLFIFICHLIIYFRICVPKSQPFTTVFIFGSKIGEKSLFTKELETALERNE